MGKQTIVRNIVSFNKQNLIRWFGFSCIK